MPNDLFQSASWPGIAGVESCSYVCSHGISPGRAVLVTYPQRAAPREFGALKFSDGRRTIVFPDCKVDRVTPEMTSEGVVYTVEILDARWRWVGLGGISGRYNQKDERGKLVPWSIRSPKELAKLCLDAMGVRNYVLNLPEGLPRAAGQNVERYLKLGENFRQSFTNPETVWDHTPPAQALAQLADYYGCRVIYQPAAQRVLVTPPGKGVPFPGLPCEVIGATIDGPEAPAFVGVFGAPVKWQWRFQLEAVGEEWDGSYVPIDLLSYAPVTGPKRPQISEVRQSSFTVEPLTVAVSFTDPRTGAKVSQTASDTATPSTVAARLNAIKAQLLANPAIGANIGIAFDGFSKLTLTGKGVFPFELTAMNPAGPDQGFTAGNVQEAADAKKWCWQFTNPPLFSNVQATPRLSYSEAQGLAQKSVFRCYRIINRDPHDLGPRDQPGRPLSFPRFGAVKRRQQVLLQDTKVELVVPQARIPGAVNKGNALGLAGINLPGQGVLPEFYNGYSREQKATVTGSIHHEIGNANWLFITKDNKKERFNTEAEARVFVEFAVNQVEQMIVFSEPVYYWQGAAGAYVHVREPVLTLETGCYLLHPETNQVVRWEEILPIPGGTAPIQWTYREDVRVGIVGRFGPNNTHVGTELFDVADAKQRAGYYLRGQAAQYQITGGETRKYIGIIPHEPDGYCQQASWSVGREGASTTLSGNTEYHPAVPPYPERRRAENLPPNKAAAEANRQERDLWKDVEPKEAK